MRKKKYPSDISREQFEQIRPLLEGARKRTKPRTVDLYEAGAGCCTCSRAAASGECYRVSEFPKWRTVHSYFAKWSEQDEEGMSLLDRALKKSGWRGPYETVAQRTADAIDCGRAEHEEHGHGGPEGYREQALTY